MVLLLGRQPALHAVAARTDDAADARFALPQAETVASRSPESCGVTVLRADDDRDDSAEGLSDAGVEVLGRRETADEDDSVKRGGTNLGDLGREELKDLLCGRGRQRSA